MSAAATPVDQIEVSMGTDLSLTISKRPKHLEAAIYSGNGIAERRLIYCTGQRAHISLQAEGLPLFWIDSVAFGIPFFELLKVADFLMLDIPLPFPLGEEVAA